jgi:predicted GIY-YIG superfamily endonuclease
MLTCSMRSYWVYILANRPRGTLYVGVTRDLVRRIYEHREGVVEGFTNTYGVKMLVYYRYLSNSARKKHQALVAQMEDRSDPLAQSRLARSMGRHYALIRLGPLCRQSAWTNGSSPVVTRRGRSHFVIAGLDPAIHADVQDDGLVEPKPEMAPGFACFGQA